MFRKFLIGVVQCMIFMHTEPYWSHVNPQGFNACKLIPKVCRGRGCWTDNSVAVTNWQWREAAGSYALTHVIEDSMPMFSQTDFQAILLSVEHGKLSCTTLRLPLWWPVNIFEFVCVIYMFCPVTLAVLSYLFSRVSSLLSLLLCLFSSAAILWACLLW